MLPSLPGRGEKPFKLYIFVLMGVNDLTLIALGL